MKTQGQIKTLVEIIKTAKSIYFDDARIYRWRFNSWNNLECFYIDAGKARKLVFTKDAIDDAIVFEGENAVVAIEDEQGDIFTLDCYAK
jgi:hypothetical protein